MKEFTINIKETLEKQVTVEAETLDEAICQVERNWKNGDYILDADNFTGAEFEAGEVDE